MKLGILPSNVEKALATSITNSSTLMTNVIQTWQAADRPGHLSCIGARWSVL